MADSTRAMRRSIFERELMPVWRNRLLTEITPDDLRAQCGKIVERGAPATAIHVRDILKQIYSYAILHGEKVANPADDVGPASIATFTPKDRALSPAEIRIMFKQLEHVATLPTIRLGMKLFLLTMVRKSELQDAVWDNDPAWIANPRAFAIQPDLPLEGGPLHTSGQPGHMRDALAGVFADAAPDSWGRRLLERAYGNGLTEFEYLTLSDDACRQGALRFQNENGDIIRGKAADAVPRLVALEAITAIARAYEQGKEISTEDMQALAGAGGSGGARPKANVQDGDTLWLAKFTSVHDQQPIERVEVATLRLAELCGIRTPTARLELADTPFPVALIQRFDRRRSARIPYISARTALGKAGAELGSYTEMVDFIRAYAADPQAGRRLHAGSA